MKTRPFLLGSALLLLGAGGALWAGCDDSGDGPEGTGGSGGASGGGGGGAAGTQGQAHPDCDPLSPQACGYPFPSNYYLVDDAKTPSGKRVAFGAKTLPKTLDKFQIDPTLFGDSDGFSPGQAPMVFLPTATATGMPTQDTIADSLKPDCPTILLDTSTGELVPHFVDLDMAKKSDDDTRALLIRPVVRLKDKTRYIAAFRQVVDGSGQPVAAPDAFKALRDGTPSSEPSIEARRALYKDIFAQLAAKGVAQADLQMAWDYTTASRENNTQSLIKMRDEALATVGADGPTYTLKAVERNDPSTNTTIDDNLVARVLLSMKVPNYLDGIPHHDDMVDPTKLNRGADGLPVQNGEAEFEVLLLIPKSTQNGDTHGILANGHGLLGDKREGQGGYLAEMANRHKYVTVSVDFEGFAHEDVPTVIEALGTTPALWHAVVDRQHQGHLNGLLAMRMMKGRIAKEGLKDENGAYLIQPGQLDPTLAFYRGDSQGGIMGTAYMALTTDVTRGLLGEPGMPYNLLLNRSKDYAGYSLILNASYRNPLDVQLLLGLLQMQWDRTEPNGYAPYITKDMFPNTPAHEVLLHVAIGDFQVTPLGAHIIARTVGAKNLTPVNRSIWGIEEAAAPITGSAMVEYSFNLPESPKTNIPPTGDDNDDPHDKVRKLDPSYDQSDEFFRKGTVSNYCNGTCDCEEVLASTLSDDDKKSCSKGANLAMSAGGSLKVILGSLVANLGIAAAKGVAAYFTGSGALLAESIHSAADCTNQILLLIGAKQAEQPPDETHPLGYGRSAYFWSFLVALMIFLGGGVMSIREGLHKVMVPDPVEHVWVGFVVLGVSLVLEAGAMVQAMVALNKKRGKVPFFAYLRATTDVDLVLLFAENGAAVIGLSFAMVALGMAAVTGDARWDGYGSIMIGVLLTLVAFFLAREVKSLLEGERADPSIDADFRAEVAADARLGEVLRVVTVQQGPSQVMLMAKIKPRPDLSSQVLIAAINELEARVRARRAEIRWQFIEPDDKD